MSFQKVICPKGARPDHPVTISVTGKKPGLVISLSAPLVARLGMTDASEYALYLDAPERLLALREEAGLDSRSPRDASNGTRRHVVFPHRPLGKYIPTQLYNTPVEMISAKKGELVFRIPADLKPSSKKAGAA